MSGRRTEIAIVGGGLAGGLIALALKRRHPALHFLLIEQEPRLGGNHRWSWFDTDLSEEGRALLAQFRKNEWPDYEVRFPAYRRQLTSPYNSLASTDFDIGLRRELGGDCLLTGAEVVRVDRDVVAFSDGGRISARAVIDCRNVQPSPHLRGGWQVFMGRHLRTDAPHGVERPIVMDADVAQHGAYRFVYTLPLGADELFVEDTYYADMPVLDRSALSSRIDEYCAGQGWQGEIVGGETGVLPVITGGDFTRYRDAISTDGVAAAGARGGFVHPLTSYTLPFAVEMALAIAGRAELPGEQLAAYVAARARAHWARTSYYRHLGRMLFQAAEPDERYRVFERFYRLHQGLVERFYAANSTLADKARILCGKPPVPIARAIAALAGSGKPLAR